MLLEEHTHSAIHWPQKL